MGYLLGFLDGKFIYSNNLPNETANSFLPPKFNTNWPPSPPKGRINSARWLPLACPFLKCPAAGNFTRLSFASQNFGGQARSTSFSSGFWSGCRESDPVYMHPMHAYYRYTTARPKSRKSLVLFFIINILNEIPLKAKTFALSSHACVLPVYYTPMGHYYLLPLTAPLTLGTPTALTALLARRMVLTQLVQAITRLPSAVLALWRLGYFLVLPVGL